MSKWNPIAVSLIGLLALAAPLPVQAFTVSTAITSGCHEAIALAALDSAGPPWGLPAPPLGEQERRVLADLPLDVPISDPWTLAFLIGIRNPDLHGLGDTDLVELAAVHGDPETQSDHCLRGPMDEGIAGDLMSLLACRATLRDEVVRALGKSEPPNPYEVEQVDVTLVVRGKLRFPLSRFAFRLGRALHTLQDSYSHTQRIGEGVGAVDNMVDVLHGGYDPAQDGPPHRSAGDRCDSDESRSKVESARQASAELLRAVGDASGGMQGRLQRLDALLDRKLQYVPGCTPENSWCGAALSGCSIAGARGADSGRAAWLLALALLALALRRRVRAALLSALFVLWLLLPAQARAETSGRLSLNTGLSGSMSRGAASLDLGLRVRLSQRWAVSLSLEYNPWISLTKPYFSAGAFNIYAGADLVWVDFKGLILRSGLQLGSSTLLQNLVAADVGSTGIFLGLSVLGFTLPLRRGVLLNVDPAWLVFAVPQLRSIPLLYEQYRIGLGLNFAM